MIMWHWWNDTDRGLPKYCKKKLFAFRFVHLKFNEDSLVYIPKLCGDQPETNSLSDPKAVS